MRRWLLLAYMVVVGFGAIPVCLHWVKTSGQDVRAPVRFLVPESQAGLAAVVQKGWTIDLCAEKCVLMNVEVESTQCPDAKHCEIEVKLTPSQALALRQYENRQKLAVVPNVVKEIK